MTKVYVFPFDKAMAEAGAKLFYELARESIHKSGRFVVALSGGKTPCTMYRLLADDTFARGISWKNVFIFWSDERLVPFDDSENNGFMAKKNLLDHVPIPAENIFRVQVQLPGSNAAKQYEGMLKAFFKEELPVFDLILLGMGDDGHTASLFAGFAQTGNQIIAAVIKPDDNSPRITFTPGLINNANHILILISGSNKAAVLKEVIENKIKKHFPIQNVQPHHGKMHWYADSAAASLLTSKNTHVHTGN